MKRYIGSALIFAAVFSLGMLLAGNKPLWKDEMYSLRSSIQGQSYAGILAGHVPQEGNNSPLFYFSQKAANDLFSYDSGRLAPVPLKAFHRFDEQTGRFRVYHFSFADGVMQGDLYSNRFLRVLPVLLMALTAAGFYWYFSFRYSAAAGVYAVLLCFSSLPFWWYGLEMRPYIYLLALTAFQVVLLLETGRTRGVDNRYWLALAGAHFLLALTGGASILQIAAALFFLLCVARPAFTWRKVAAVFVAPAAVIAGYYALADKYGCHFGGQWYKYFLINIPPEILVMTGVCGVYLFFSRRKAAEGSAGALPGLTLVLAGITSGLYVLALLGLKRIERPLEPGVFYFAYRHVIALMPLGVVVMTIATFSLWGTIRRLWLRLVFGGGVILLLVWRFYDVIGRSYFWIGI